MILPPSRSATPPTNPEEVSKEGRVSVEELAALERKFIEQQVALRKEYEQRVEELKRKFEEDVDERMVRALNTFRGSIFADSADCPDSIFAVGVCCSHLLWYAINLSLDQSCSGTSL